MTERDFQIAEEMFGIDRDHVEVVEPEVIRALQQDHLPQLIHDVERLGRKMNEAHNRIGKIGRACHNVDLFLWRVRGLGVNLMLDCKQLKRAVERQYVPCVKAVKRTIKNLEKHGF